MSTSCTERTLDHDIQLALLDFGEQKLVQRPLESPDDVRLLRDTAEETGVAPVGQEDTTGRYSRRVRKAPFWFTGNELRRTLDDDKPTTTQALKVNEADKWDKAIDKEITELQKRSVWK